MSTRLEQQSDSFAYYQGWYGKCPDTGDSVCESFPLLTGDLQNPGSLEKKYPQILKVLETSANYEGQTSYIGTIPDGAFLTTQIIKELLCGHSYLIVLKKGTGSIDIPEFTFANAGTNDDLEKNRLALNCEVLGCPTCEDYTGSSSTFNIDLQNLPIPAQESVHVVVYDSSVEGTLCYAEVDAGLPKTYYAFLDSSTAPFASITIAGELRGTKNIKYTINDDCYGAEPTIETYTDGDINVYRFKSIGTTIEPVPTPTDTPEPINVPTPTETPSPSDTPDNVPTPTETPSPSDTPDNVPTPTETPSPSATPSHTPSHTPSPTFTPSPSETPSATITPDIIEPCCDAGMITGIVGSEVTEISMEITAQPFDCVGTICLNSNITSSMPTSVRINVNGTYMGALGVQGTLNNGTSVKLTISSTTNSSFDNFVGICLTGIISDNICNLTE